MTSQQPDLDEPVETSPSRVDPEAEAARGAPGAAPEGRAVGGAPAQGELDTDSPAYYLNRELTWLEFNWRVLHEAEDERTPLLERVKFLAIVNSNLDEFLMKRIGGLKQQVGAGMHEVTVDGRTPREQIAEGNAGIARPERRCRGGLGER